LRLPGIIAILASAASTAADFLPKRDACFPHFKHPTGVAAKEESYL
jgi:hypothetical protein